MPRLKDLGAAALAVSVALLASPAGAFVEPKAPPSVAPPGEVVDWVKRHEIPVALSVEPSAREARALSHLLVGARVVGLGESNHGNQEPLAYRNRLIRYLVEREGLTAVALESGLAESRPLYDYVLGGPGDPEALTRTGLTHGFGVLRENVELLEWLRDWNAAHPNRPVHFYGIDLSTVQSAGPAARGYGLVLQHLDDYLRRTDAEASAVLRARLARFFDRFTENDYPRWSEADRAEAHAMLGETAAFLKANETEMVRASSPLDWAWAAREAGDARTLVDAFATWDLDPTHLEALFRILEIRDGEMARNTEWALEREGPDGKVLLFQANGHIAAHEMMGSVMRLFPKQPDLTGILLRKDLGRGYRAIATVSSRGKGADDPRSGSLDRAFAAAGGSPALLDLGALGRPVWWEKSQSASQGEDRLDDFAPAKAFDALVYFDRLTPAQRLAPPEGS